MIYLNIYLSFSTSFNGPTFVGISNWIYILLFSLPAWDCKNMSLVMAGGLCVSAIPTVQICLIYRLGMEHRGTNKPNQYLEHYNSLVSTPIQILFSPFCRMEDGSQSYMPFMVSWIWQEGVLCCHTHEVMQASM